MITQKYKSAIMTQEKFVKREYNNGHKTFIASEAKAFHEQLRAEKSRKEYFDAYKHTMMRDRNPLVGDPTPRVDPVTGIKSHQEPIINPNWVPRPLPEFVTKKEKLTEKIGVDVAKYYFLGNNYMTNESKSRASSRPSESGGSFRPSSSARNTGSGVVSATNTLPCSPISRTPSRTSSRPSTSQSTLSRPGSEWKNRLTAEGTLKPMMRFF